MNSIGGRYSRISLLEHTGYGNLGDDATVAAVLHHLKHRWPDARISAITLNPRDTSERYSIPAWPIHRDCKVPPTDALPVNRIKAALRSYSVVGRLLRVLWAMFVRYPRNLICEIVFLIQCRRAVRSLDLLVICGGGQLRDNAGGPYKFPFTILKWVLLASLGGAKCYFLNLGSGPLRTRSSRLFVRAALHFSSYTSFRDERSRLLIQEIGSRRSSSVHADCVYALPLSVPGRPSVPGAALGTVGISPMRVYWDRDPQIYARLIRELGLLGRWLGKLNYPLCLFSTENPSDCVPIDDLHAAIRSVGNIAPIRCPRIRDLDGLLRQMSAMEYVVTCRFHGVVFAHLLNIPVLAVSHHPKVSTLMSDLGLSDYCLDLHTVTFEELTKAFTRLQENQTKIRGKMQERAISYHADLMQQFDMLFPPATGSCASEPQIKSVPVGV